MGGCHHHLTDGGGLVKTIPPGAPKPPPSAEGRAISPVGTPWTVGRPTGWASLSAEWDLTNV